MNTRLKKLTMALAGGLLLGGLSIQSSQGATLTVNTFSDELTSGCSLREAVISVDNGGDRGGCVADITSPYGTNDTINLPEGTYLLSIPPPADVGPSATGTDNSVLHFGEYTATYVAATAGAPATYAITAAPDPETGDLDIMKSVSIVGQGAGATIDAGWIATLPYGSDAKADPLLNTCATGSICTATAGDRVFHVIVSPTDTTTTAINLTLSNLIVKGGKALGAATFPGPDGGNYYFRREGGGLAETVGAAAGAVVTATDPGTGGGGGGSTGGGEVTTVTYGLTINHCIFTSNYAGDGGGIYSPAVMTATNLVASGNRASANGGGIYNDAAATLISVTLSGNSAEGGGGLFDTGSHTTTIIGSTVNGNVAVGGGGISSRSGVKLEIDNSTISGNSAGDVGAGLYTNGPAFLTYSTVADNSSPGTTGETVPGGAGINIFQSGSASVTVQNTLVARNTKGNPAVNANCGQTGSTSNWSFRSLGNNIDSDGTCTLTMSGDKSGNFLGPLDPGLGFLANNGGPTQTQALLSGSIAIGAAKPLGGTIFSVDERGVARDATPDIGAFEVAATSSGGSSSGCFIATAAYGTPMAQDVRYLRAFRDEYLLTNAPGRVFVGWYYRFSPPVADYLRQHDTLRGIVRVGLVPLVEVSKLTVSQQVLQSETVDRP